MAKRRIGLGVTGLADALIFCRTRYGSAESVALIDTLAVGDQRCGLSRLGRNRRREGLLPAVRCARVPGAAFHACACRSMCARPSRRTACATGFSPPLRRPARSRCSPAMYRAASSPSSPTAIRARSCRRTVASREEIVEDYAYRAFRARFGARCRAAGLFRQCPDAVAGRSSGRAGGGAAPYRQLDLQDHQRAGWHFASTSSRTSISAPTNSAARAARPIVPMT